MLAVGILVITVYMSPYPRAQKTTKGEFQVAKRLLGPDFPSCEKLNH
jgi:hypothetical protein